MSITNESKPVASLSNTARINTGETWASISTTWASETRTWQEIGSFITNATKVSSSIVNQNKP